MDVEMKMCCLSCMGDKAELCVSSKKIIIQKLFSLSIHYVHEAIFNLCVLYVVRKLLASGSISMIAIVPKLHFLDKIYYIWSRKCNLGTMVIHAMMINPFPASRNYWNIRAPLHEYCNGSIFRLLMKKSVIQVPIYAFNLTWVVVELRRISQVNSFLQYALGVTPRACWGNLLTQSITWHGKV